MVNTKIRGDLADQRELNYKLSQENQKLKYDLNHQAFLKETHAGWVADHVLLLTKPEEVIKFSSSLDGEMINRLNIKVSIHEDKEQMMKELYRMLVLLEPCFKKGNDWI